jgi:hypothetical protein
MRSPAVQSSSWAGALLYAMEMGRRDTPPLVWLRGVSADSGAVSSAAWAMPVDPPRIELSEPELREVAGT